MKIFSWLLGRRRGREAPSASEDRPPAVRETRVVSFMLGLGTRKRRADRRVAEHFLLRPGRYELRATSSGRGAYAPRGRAAQPPDGGWHHRVHLVLHTPIYPLESGAAEPPAELAHRVFVHPSTPGPFARASEARDAFRSIPAEARRFQLDAPARAVFWIEMDGAPGDGDMGFELIRRS